MHSADHDLDAQQQHLAAQKYDLRITNLARFIYSKIQQHLFRHPERSEGSRLDSSSTAQNDKKLLDVGAGNGLFLKFFKDKGFEVSGFELEQENVDAMKKDPQLMGVDIRQGDITKLTGNASYDIVIASDVIEHIKDDQKAVDQLWTFVAPGGMLIITVPAHSFLYGTRDEMWGHYRRYDKKYLLSIIRNITTTPSPMAIGETPPYKGGEPKKRKTLLLSKEESPKGEVVFITFWNTLGFFVYYFYEKILHKPINEKMRYSDSFMSRVAKWLLDKKLKAEEMIGGTLLGLTLVVGVKKES